MQYTPRAASLTIAILASMLAGVLGFLALVGPAAFFSAQSRLVTADRNILNSITASLTRAYTFLYGTVTQVDPAAQTIDIALKDPFGGADEAVQLKVEIPAYIARQDLHTTNGIVDGLSRQTISTLADIHPGDRIAFTMKPDANGTMVTRYILFGNPL